MTTDTRSRLPGESFLRILEQIKEHAAFGQTCGISAVFGQSAPNDATDERSPSIRKQIRRDDVEPESSGASLHANRSLETLQHQLDGCQRCALHAGRAHIVFGSGNPQAALMLIGAAPNEHEDRLGVPFVGPDGELLTKILNAVQLRRENVYLTNIVKCRPPDNRNPAVDEITTCAPFLQQQIARVRPKIICVLGQCAAQTILQSNAALSELRGHFYDYGGMPVMPTYHPADLLQYPEYKRAVWQDMQQVQQAYYDLISATEAGV